MNPNFIPDSIWHSLGFAMLHFLWVGTLVGLLVWLVQATLLRRAAPSARYGFGVGGLGVIALSAGMCVWFQWPGETEAEVATSEAPVPVVQVAVSEERLGENTAAAPVELRPTDAKTPNLVDAPAESETGMTADRSKAEKRDWIAVLPWVWVLGAAGSAMFLCFGFIGSWRLRSTTTTDGLEGPLAQCDRLRRRLGIGARVLLAASGRVTSPIVVGVLRPVIVLPSAAVSGMSPAMIEWILLHELAHVRRLDNAVIVLQRMVESALFFHPAIWIASCWVNREREFCCDEFALRNNQDEGASSYAETLASLAGVHVLSLAPASAMASHAVVHRIRRVLNGSNRHPRGGSLGALAGVFLIGIVSASMVTWAFSKPDVRSEKGEVVPEEGFVKEVKPAVDGKYEDWSFAVINVGEDETPKEKEDYEKARIEKRKGMLEEVDRIWEKAELEALVKSAVPPVETTSKTVDGEGEWSDGMTAKSYRVPPDFLSTIGGKLTLQAWLEEQGIKFPVGSFAMFEPRRSVVILRHSAPATKRIEREIEAVIPRQKLQFSCATKLVWRRGKEFRGRDGMTVLTVEGMKAEVAHIKEQVVLGEGEKKRDVENLGMQWDMETSISKDGKVTVSGNVLVRVPKGKNPVDFMNPIGGWDFEESVKKKPELDIYRAMYAKDVTLGDPVEIALEGPADKRLLKRVRREKGALVGMLTVNLIDAAGKPSDTPADLKKALQPFKLSAHPLRKEDAKELERIQRLAQGYFDLGMFAEAELQARAALAMEPSSKDAYDFWRKTVEMLAKEKPSERWDPKAWIDRQYWGIPDSLLPIEAMSGTKSGDDALRAYLSKQGIEFPEGATVKLTEDAKAIEIRNQGAEIEKLEALLDGRFLELLEGVVYGEVEMFSGDAETLTMPIEGEKFLGITGGIEGIFTDPQYQVVRRALLANGAKKMRVPTRRLSPGRRSDVFEGLPLDGLGGVVDVAIDPDRYSISADISVNQFGKDVTLEEKLKGGHLSQSVTVWDGMTICLSVIKENGDPALVFLKLWIGDPEGSAVPK